MSWHGSTRTQGGRVTLTPEQWKMLGRLAADNEYWQSAHNFMQGMDGKELTSLSQKQLDWYGDIEASLDVEINRCEARIAFGLEVEDE